MPVLNARAKLKRHRQISLTHARRGWGVLELMNGGFWGFDHCILISAHSMRPPNDIRSSGGKQLPPTPPVGRKTTIMPARKEAVWSPDV